MNTSTIEHTAAEMQIDTVTIRAAFWKDSSSTEISSILKMASPCWDVQINITSQELRQLAALLVKHAANLDLHINTALMEAV